MRGVRLQTLRPENLAVSITSFITWNAYFFTLLFPETKSCMGIWLRMSVMGKETAEIGKGISGADERHLGKACCVMCDLALPPLIHWAPQWNQVPVSTWFMVGIYGLMEDTVPAWPQGKGRKSRGVQLWCGYVCKIWAYFSFVQWKSCITDEMLCCMSSWKASAEEIHSQFFQKNRLFDFGWWAHWLYTDFVT